MELRQETVILLTEGISGIKDHLQEKIKDTGTLAKSSTLNEDAKEYFAKRTKDYQEIRNELNAIMKFLWSQVP